MWFSDWSTKQNHDILYIFCYANIPESRNVKVAMKKIAEEENEDFCEEEYFNFEVPWKSQLTIIL